jgi:hypothetical protein
MTSQINPNAIDATFPISGEDNSAQGFRNNFAAIKNSLVYAKAEISNLQEFALNDPIVPDAAVFQMNFMDGEYQIVNASTNLNVIFIDQSLNKLRKTRVEFVNVSNASKTVQFDSAIYSIFDGDSFPVTYTTSLVVDVWAVGTDRTFVKIVGVI